MSLGKPAATVVIAGVLAVQLFGVSPWGRGGWYWPFLDYPMYSAAKYPGATFGLFELDAIACDGTTRRLEATDLRIPRFRFRNALEVAAGGRPDLRRTPDDIEASRRTLSRLIVEHLPGGWCAARVHGRIFAIDHDGLASADVPRRLLAEWRVGTEAAR